MRRALAGLAALGAGGAVGWSVVGLRDARAIAEDPEYAILEAPLSGEPRTVTAADGTELHAEVFGPDGAPTVVLVHGWLCTALMWRLQVRELMPELRVVTYDHRGHGQSSPAPTEDYSADALAADLRAVLDQTVPRDEQAIVVGHSMGAMAVVAWADANPADVASRLAGAVLVNVGVEELVRRSTIIPFPAGLATLRVAVGGRILGAKLRLPARPNPVLSRVVRAIGLGPGASPAQVAFFARMVLTCAAEVRAAFGATLTGFDLAQGVSKLTVPTVVVAGENDRLTPPVHARAIVEALPDATLVELPGVGHGAPLEAHVEVTGAIQDLARRVLLPT